MIAVPDLKTTLTPRTAETIVFCVQRFQVHSTSNSKVQKTAVIRLAVSNWVGHIVHKANMAQNLLKSARLGKIVSRYASLQAKFPYPHIVW